jgi:chloramphenicol-sensitive protein RarD
MCIASARRSEYPVTLAAAWMSMPPHASPTPARSGIVYSIAAYGLWGLFPLYFKALDVTPLEFLLHRVLWSALLLSGVLTAQRRWSWLWEMLRQRGVLLGSFVSASLLTVNWFIYIWAVTSHRVLDASLGYFINPLFSVVLGVILLKERLRALQWLAIALAALGVLWLTLQLGELPWVGLALAASFGGYGILRKTAALGAFEGLLVETLLLLPFALVALAVLVQAGRSGFLNGGASDRALLIFAGPLTVLPLVLFAAGARRIPLSLLGVLQYLAPTEQLLLGVLLWHEPFGTTKVVGYACIWLALVVYAGEGGWFAVSHGTPRPRAP